MRRTKIISTIGPATDNPEVLKKIILAGTNLVRINMSHGDLTTQLARIEQVKTVAKSVNQIIGILVDFQGPKIRIAKFKEGAVQLIPGTEFILDASLDKTAGTDTSVGLDYPDLTQDVSPGDFRMGYCRRTDYFNRSRGRYMGSNRQTSLLQYKKKPDQPTIHCCLSTHFIHKNLWITLWVIIFLFEIIINYGVSYFSKPNKKFKILPLKSMG